MLNESAFNFLLFILLFGVLVFIHELGHFTVAKLSGVFVERFALGFGPAFFKKKWGETEYALCLVPLGGYVKMRGEGEDPAAPQDTQDPRSFANQSVWTRIAIVIMGPLANLLLPIALFTCFFMVGSKAPSTSIGSVLKDSPAFAAGIQPFDQIIAINDQKTNTWTEVTSAIRKSSGSIKLQIKRNTELLHFQITPTQEETFNAYGEKIVAPTLGIDVVPYAPVVGMLSEKSPAFLKGLQTGDKIVSINGTPMRTWADVEHAFSPSVSSLRLDVERTNEKNESPQKITVDLKGKFASTVEAGFEEGSMYLKHVLPESVAATHGLLKGDKIVRVNQTPTHTWETFKKMVQGVRDEKLSVEVLRQGKTETIDLTPQEVSHKDELTSETKKHKQLGVLSCALPQVPEFTTVQYQNPFKALYYGVHETVSLSVSTLVGLWKLVRGKLSMNTLGGPISIYYLAGNSFKLGGWETFFRMMAMLSITLAVMNLLPIPVLDGGHLFFFIIEALKGSPVSEKLQMVGQKIGLTIVLGLMFLTFYVDIKRFFFEKIKLFFMS